MPVEDEPTLTLFATGLCSKWGFGDGDVVREFLLDLVDAGLLEDHPNNPLLNPYQVDQHRVLRQIVRERLLLIIPFEVEVYDIETIHNPIRARLVAGHEVDDYALDQPAEELLKPYSINVPWRDVVRLSGLDVVMGEVILKAINTSKE